MIHTVFDKSFLQSLSVDESVWFDHFYKPVVCPIFYTETLADLAHEGLKDRTPDRAVQIIADKFPDLSGVPCADHRTLTVGDLLGHKLPLDGRIPLTGGRTVRSSGETGVVFEESPEAVAFGRWQKGEFSELERTYASGLRRSLAELDLATVASSLQSLGITNATVRSVQDAKAFADDLVTGFKQRAERLYIALKVFDIPDATGYRILQRWESGGRPPLSEFAPYAAYVLTVELFFHVAIGAQLIGSARQSNRTDIAYLYYLPFSHAFVSSDRLHKQCAPLFLRADQRFLWGPDLKADLRHLNDHYNKLPELERERGIFEIARKPPLEGDYLTARLYDAFDPGWREEKPISRLSPEAEKAIVERANALRDSTDLSPRGTPVAEDDIRALSVPHIIRRRKGNWWQLPKNLQVPNES